ncbi:hypothetical protein CGC21_10845 [Leishmania donovani]|uniref:Uncharacterized protein n=1 Tax=Leishmania donovani TaxID=5661 RepID=A0A504X2Y4_LEIDO|nr:hypothetical protein CGC21_10845 [Leishmania donovani]
MKAHLKTLGIAFTYIHAPGKMHANLSATLPASNDASQPGVVMSGRMDIVPVDGRKWDTSPFSKKLARFVFSYGEGVGCVDAPVIMAQLKLQSLEADGCLVGNGGFHADRVHDNAIRSAMGLIEASCNFTASATRIITEVREIGLERGRRSPHAFEYQRPFYSLSVCLIKGRNAVSAEINSMGSVPAFDSPEETALIHAVRETRDNHTVRGLATLGMPIIIVASGGYCGHMASACTEVVFLKKREKLTEELVQQLHGSRAWNSLPVLSTPG